MNVPGLHRSSTPPGMPPPEALRQPSKLSFGTVCSSNINRSMEAHVVLQNAGEKIDIILWCCVIIILSLTIWNTHRLVSYRRYSQYILSHTLYICS